MKISSFNTSSGSEIEQTVIVGSKGELRFSFFGDHTILLRQGEKETVFKPDIPAHIQQPLIQSVVDDLLGKGTCPSTGKTASRTNWVMEQVCKRYDT